MKKLISVIAAITAIFAPITAITEGGEYFILCKPGSTVNARISPRKSAEVVGWLECGDAVKTDGKQKNGYVHIIDCSMECSEAWISSRYLVKDQPITCYIQTTVIGNGKVKSRNYVNGKTVHRLKPNTAVTIYAYSEEWCVTNKGYIQTQYLGVN